MREHELAEFLRLRRAALRPEDVGLPSGARRRVVGMRREEIARLANMSVNYYTRLEQGRAPQPSASMLASIARAMRLTLDERDYLYRVADHPAPDRLPDDSHVSPGLLRVLDGLDDTPAVIFSALLETLVANDMAIALFGDHTARTGLERYEIYRWFTDPRARELYPDHDRDRQSRAIVANLRAAYGLMGPRSRAGELVSALESRSAEFAELWAEQRVARRFEDHKVLIHPELGPLELDCQALTTEDGGQVLLVLTAPPRSETRSRLDLLAVLGSERLASHQA